MAEFISSFATGFQKIVEKDLPRRIPGCKILNVFDGLIHYSFNGNSRNLEKIIYFNNTFFAIKTSRKFLGNFSSMANDFCREKKYFLINKGTFRVRFSKENRFEKVDKNLVLKIEENIVKNSKLKIDRVSPSTEIWFSIRRDNFAFCGQLISKREFTEKNLNKGELRPELAYLICRFADFDEDAAILEPFCGYGSIPTQLVKKFRFARLFASDIDEEKIKILKEKKQFENKKFVKIEREDAFSLKSIPEKSIDVVIADPPWGFYEEAGDICDFYDKTFRSFDRILKQNGKIIILSARKEEIQKAAQNRDFKILEKIDTLVNGKKASLYKFAR